VATASTCRTFAAPAGTGTGRKGEQAMFARRALPLGLGQQRSHRATARQLRLLVLALGVVALGGCETVSISASQGTPRPTRTVVSMPATRDVAQTSPPATTATTQSTPPATRSPQPTTAAQPTTTAQPSPTAQPTATPQPTPTPVSTSSGGATTTFLGLVVLALCCAVTGIIVWLVANRRGQPPTGG
jgi:hypothetical protein